MLQCPHRAAWPSVLDQADQQLEEEEEKERIERSRGREREREKEERNIKLMARYSKGERGNH